LAFVTYRYHGNAADYLNYGMADRCSRRSFRDLSTDESLAILVRAVCWDVYCEFLECVKAGTCSPSLALFSALSADSLCGQRD